VTGNEAIRALKAAGFRHVRTDTSGHSHYELGKHRIMVSPGSQDIKDSSTIQRIEKLCHGDLTARDLQREAHQQKGELPNDLFRLGDRVEHTEDESRGVGVVHTVNWQERTATVEWKQYTSKNVPLSELKLSRKEEEPVQVEIPEKPAGDVVDNMQPLPLPVEEKTLEVRTLLDELQNLELVSEIEYEELMFLRDSLLKRVHAYEQVYSIKDQLGIAMKRLPWKEVPESPITVVESPKPVITTTVDFPAAVEQAGEPPPAPVEVQVPISRSDGEQMLLEYIKAHGGSISKMAVGHIKSIPNVEGKLLSLTQQGRLLYSVEPDKAGRQIRRWTLV